MEAKTSSRRRSEILAINISRTEKKDRGQDLFLYPNINFVPKTKVEGTAKASSC